MTLARLLLPSRVWAPEPGPQTTTLTGEPRVGATLTCSGPAWSLADTGVRYRFVSYRYREGTRVVQDGPSTTYVVAPTDAGRLIVCQALGTTAGGTLGAPGSAGVRIQGA